jgi:hypothetical protein
VVVIVWFVIKLDRRGKLLGGSVLLFRLAVEILASRGALESREACRAACLLRTKLEARSILRPATARCSVRITTSLER